MSEIINLESNTEGSAPFEVSHSSEPPQNADSNTSAMDVDTIDILDIPSNIKKRKEQTEAMEESTELESTPSKKRRLASATSPKKSSKEIQEELALKREAEKREKENAAAKLKAEREAKRLKEEEEKHQRQLEREAKKLAAEEAKRLKEEEKKAKEAEKKQKEEEKRLKEEEKRLQREAAQKAKEEEKRQKEEEKKQKEEEKRQREEEKKQKEEEKRQRMEERKKEIDEKAGKKKKKIEVQTKQSSVLMSFLKSSQSNSESKQNAGEDDVEMSEPLRAQFEKVGAFLAWEPPLGAILPLMKKNCATVDDVTFEKSLNEQTRSTTELMNELVSKASLYLESRSKKSIMENRRKRFSHNSKFDQISSVEKRERLKNLVIENRIKLIVLDPISTFRKPYFGTYTLKSLSTRSANEDILEDRFIEQEQSICGVTGKRPFGKLKGIDYEIESDEESFDSFGEAEEEEEGDSVDSSDQENGGTKGKHKDDDDEEDLSGPDEYEIDNEFLVPDGHFSDSEMLNSDDSDDEHVTRAKLDSKELLAQTKRRLNNKNKKLAQLTPILLGPVYDLQSLHKNMESLQNGYNSGVSSQKISLLLSNHSLKTFSSFPLSLEPVVDSSDSSGNKPGYAPKTIHAETMPLVAKFIHEEYQSSFDKLLANTRTKFPESSKRQLGMFIKDKCEKVKTEANKNGVWLVKKSLRQSLGLPEEDPTPPPGYEQREKPKKIKPASDSVDNQVPSSNTANNNLEQPENANTASATPTKPKTPKKPKKKATTDSAVQSNSLPTILSKLKSNKPTEESNSILSSDTNNSETANQVTSEAHAEV